MSAQPASERHQGFDLAADGAVISAAVFALLTGVVLLAAQLSGDREVPVWLQIASGLSMWVGGIAGPLLVWLLHDRRVTWPAVIGAVVSLPVAGAVFFVFVALSAAVGWVISPISDADWAGPLALAVLLFVAFAGLSVLVCASGLRDLRSQPPLHRRLDVARVATVVGVAAFSGIVIALAFANTGGEIIEALAFMLLGAVSGAAMVTCADVATRLLTPRQPEPAPAGGE